ncbi:MAG: hypothetical protein A3K19_05850 [Lentisphaerae bacterium RIFOXYB12_FULL_65_16]|nr:MAG: hypothetical protein A3K18_15465 [Lentisphaerae bacterium RIFOXYA12_64_32]OGV95096.1 MAG: hypothetical protein A3K19_05850 [Lentisphaerae bacterium RIFOXYB12_FULL_65_16]
MKHDSPPVPGLEPAVFARLDRQYRKRWRVSLYGVRPDGTLACGKLPCRADNDSICNQTRALALQEALRWGDPTIVFCPAGRLLWAVPMMHNARIVGGLVASVAEAQVFPDGQSPVRMDLRRAAAELRVLAERENLTNAAALALSRLQCLAEQQRAHAIHASKAYRHHGIRALYLREEPSLFSAIRAGDRGEARAILNRILLVIHQHAGDRLDLVKSIFMELIVSMCRTAVEAGGDPEELLGANFASFAELSQLRNETDVAHWLARTLEQLMDAIHRHRQRTTGAVLLSALAYIEKHIAAPISRDDVAHAVYLSPSHFSFLIHKESGTTFTDLLNRARTDRAAELLGQRRLSIREVASQTGFDDPSYFTKVFKRYRHQTPLQYRRHLSLPAVAAERDGDTPEP